MVTFPRLGVQFQRRIDEYLFAPGSAANLGFLRCLFFGYVFWLFVGQPSWPWADVSPLFWSTWSSVDLLGLPPLSKPVLMSLDVLWKASLLLSCLGLFTRWSTKVSLILGVYLLGLPQNYCKISHLVGLLVLTMLVLAFSKCGEALALDNWWPRRRQRSREKVARQAAGEFTWPVRLVWLVHSVAFFAAGWAKLAGEGWIFSDHLRYQFILHHYLDDRSLLPIGLYLAQSSLLCMLLALWTVVIELAAPLAMFHRGARKILIPSLLMLQLGNAFILGVHSTLPWLCVYAFWVPWDQLGQTPRRWWRKDESQYSPGSPSDPPPS